MTPTPAPLPTPTTAPPVIEVIVEGGRDWWAILLQGPVTAFIAAGGLFLLYRLTREHQVQDERDRRRRERQKADYERMVDFATRLLVILLEFRQATNRNDAAVIEDARDRIVNELVIVQAHIVRDRPNAGIWLSDAAAALAQCADDPAQLQSIGLNVNFAICTWIDSEFNDEEFRARMGTRTPTMGPSAYVIDEG